MRGLIRNITRKRSGVSHDDHPFDGDHIGIGRAPSHPIFLSDLRVALSHARISKTPDSKFQIVAQALSGIRVNGETTDMANISVDDQIKAVHKALSEAPAEKLFLNSSWG